MHWGLEERYSSQRLIRPEIKLYKGLPLYWEGAPVARRAYAHLVYLRRRSTRLSHNMEEKPVVHVVEICIGSLRSAVFECQGEGSMAHNEGDCLATTTRGVVKVECRC